MFSDPILQSLEKKYPSPVFTDRSEYLFEDLIDTIISQQLSGKAAATIFSRFQQVFPPNIFPSPEEVLTIDQQELRKVGISHAKTGYIKNVAHAFVKKEIVVEEIRHMNDEEVIKKLTNIKGIGKWSAEMILIFTLKRPDVFSLGDLGLTNALKNLYGISDKKEILSLTNTWSPHRSTASWYLWRSLENR